jgi:hypothetical protein
VSEGFSLLGVCGQAADQFAIGRGRFAYVEDLSRMMFARKDKARISREKGLNP